VTGQHPTLEETAALAGTLHAAQADKAGRPYIGHLARVSAHLRRLFPDASFAERHAAWLHDAIEDTEMTAAGLAELAYDPAVITIVEALTRDGESGLSYQQWIENIVATGLRGAMRVKLADLADNSDPSRLALLPSERTASLAKRYDKARATLEAALADLGGAEDADDPPPIGHVPITLAVSPLDFGAFTEGAELAERSVEGFIAEEALYLAHMLIAAGPGHVVLARDRRKRVAALREAMSRPSAASDPIRNWALSQGYRFAEDGENDEKGHGGEKA